MAASVLVIDGIDRRGAWRFVTPHLMKVAGFFMTSGNALRLDNATIAR